MGYVYEEKELELTVKGKVYKFRQPSAIEQKEMAVKFREASDDTHAVDMYVDFFVNLGIPKDVLVKFSMEGLIGLFGYAVGAKKN